MIAYELNQNKKSICWIDFSDLLQLSDKLVYINTYFDEDLNLPITLYASYIKYETKSYYAVCQEFSSDNLIPHINGWDEAEAYLLTQDRFLELEGDTSWLVDRVADSMPGELLPLIIREWQQKEQGICQ